MRLSEFSEVYIQLRPGTHGLRALLRAAMSVSTERSPLLEVSSHDHSSTADDPVQCNGTVHSEVSSGSRFTGGGALFPSWWSWRGDVRQRLKKAYQFRSLVAVKPVESFLIEREARPEGQRLSESLGLLDLVGYGVGCTVGAGIYSLIGIGAQIAGPAILISFIIGAVSCVFTALAYSEFAARVPVTGSAYTFAYASLGELLAWIIGWNLTLEYCISSAAIARGWGDYFFDFWIGWGFESTPTWLSHIPLGSTSLSPAAAFIVIVCTAVMLFGISTSSTFNVIMTILNVFVLVFFTAVGATRVTPSNWVVVNNSFVPFGAASLFAGAGRVFFAYLGFDMVSSLAEETRHPQKNIPRGIIASLVISTTLYVAVSLVATGMVDFRQLTPNGPSHNAPLSYAMEAVGLHWAGRVISFGSIFGLTTATFTCLLGQPRIFYTMARDGLFFPVFHWTSKRLDTPVIGTILTGAFTAILAFFMTLDDLADAISIGTLLAFSLVCAGVMVLRYTRGPTHYLPTILITTFSVFSLVSALTFHYSFPLPVTLALAVIGIMIFIAMLFLKATNIPSTFKCPLVPFVPCMGIAINMYMMAGLSYTAWIRLFVWMVIGVAIYFLYGIYCSKLRTTKAAQTQQSSNGDVYSDRKVN